MADRDAYESESRLQNAQWSQRLVLCSLMMGVVNLIMLALVAFRVFSRPSATVERFDLQVVGTDHVLLLDRITGRLWIQIDSPGFGFVPMPRFDTTEEAKRFFE